MAVNLALYPSLLSTREGQGWGLRHALASLREGFVLGYYAKSIGVRRKCQFLRLRYRVLPINKT